jgi:CRP-like cAMP-binding protein
MDIQKFFPNAQELNLKKGQTLYDADSNIKPRFIYYITDGIAALMNTDINGSSRTFLFLPAPRFILYFPLISEKIQDEYDDPDTIIFPAIAFTKIHAYKIPAPEFLELFENSLEFRRIIDTQIHRDYVNLLQNYASASQDTACTRVCKFLLKCACKENGELCIKNFITYKELASYIGVHEVTVARLMAQLIKYEYIKKNGRTIIIKKPDALRSLIDAHLDLPYTK